MQDPTPLNDPTPSGCFRQAEIESFQSFEHQKLAGVHYYLWRVNARSSFLYALELYFEPGGTLLLSSGAETDAISIITPEVLVETARKLQSMHGEALIQRIVAGIQPLWRDAIGSMLLEIRLTRHDSGLYSNEALLFGFENKEIVLELAEKDGLILGEYEFE